MIESKYPRMRHMLALLVAPALLLASAFAQHSREDRSDRSDDRDTTRSLANLTPTATEPIADAVEEIPFPDFRDDIDVLENIPSVDRRSLIYAPYRLPRFIERKEVVVDDTTTEIQFSFEPPFPDRLPPRLDTRFWLVGPPGGTIQLEWTNIEWYVWDDQNEVEVGPFSIDDQTEWGELPLSIRQTRVVEVDVFRQLALFRTEINLIQPIGRDRNSNQDLAWVRRATLRAVVPNSSSPADLSREDPYLLELLRNEVANPSQMQRVAMALDPIEDHETFDAWSKRLQRSSAAGLLLQGKLPRGGIYTLAPSDFQRLGINPDDLPVERLQFFIGYREVPVAVTGLNRGRFMGDARIHLYSPHDPADRIPYRALWIMLAPDGESPRRSNFAPLRGASEGDVPGTITVTVFEPLVYNDKMPSGAPQLSWAVASLAPDQFAEIEFQAVQVRPNESVLATVWYTMMQNGAADVVFFVNGTEVFRENTRGVRLIERQFHVPGHLLRRGTNVFAARNAQPERDTHGPLQFIMARLELPVTSRQLQAQALLTADEDVPSTRSIRFHAGEHDGDSAILVNATDPYDPAFSQLRLGRDNQSPYWTGALTGDNRRPHLTYVPTEFAYPVVELQRVSPPRSFSEDSQVDMLVITHPSLQAALAPLIEHRRQSMTVDVIGTDDLYNVFSAGEISYQAIHRAINHAYRHRHPPRMQKVLLVGEGSEYWWEYRRASPGVSRNLLPVYGWQDNNITIRGDDSYALLNGRGGIADVELGRLSTEDPAELSAMVEKIIRYETDPQPGPWRHRHLFVTDDEPEFASVCREIVSKTFGGANLPVYMFLQNFPYEDYFRGFWRKRSTTMTDDLLRQWRDGALTLTYVGHGGPNLWSSERILHIRDVENIEDGGRHPFLTAGSCDTGWVDYPIEPVRASLAEHLTRNPRGGAIAAFIPISGTSSFEHNFLLSALYEAMLDRGHRRVGTISLMSKLNYYLPRQNSRVTNQYLLLGDPATMLPPPPPVIPVKVTPTEVLAGSEETLEVEGRFPGVPWGVVEAVVLDPDRQAVAEERFRIVNGVFSGSIKLPLQLLPGDYVLMTIATSDDSGKQAAAFQNIRVHRHNIRFEWICDPPLDKPMPAGTPLKLKMRVTNASPIALRSAVIAMEDADAKERFRGEIDLGAGQVFEYPLDFPLPVGINVIRGKLYLRGDIIKPVAEDTLLLLGRNPDGRPIDVSIGETRVEYLANAAGTRIAFPIYSLLEEPIEFFEARLELVDGDTTKTIGQRRIRKMDGGSRRIFSFTTREIIPVGSNIFRLHLVHHPSGEIAYTQQFNLDTRRGPDLEIVNGEVILENLNPRAGNSVFVNFRVRNVGDSPAYRVKPVLYLNQPWSENDKAPNAAPWDYAIEIPMMLPREEREFRLRWDPQGTASSSQVLFAAVSGRDAEARMDNNVARVTVNLLASANLAIDRAGIYTSQEVVQPYDRVYFSVPFINNSTQDFMQEFRVAVTALGHNGHRRRLTSTRYESLAAGESGTIQFDWLCLPGEYAVEVNVNVDREYLELTYNDNVHTFSLPYVLPVAMVESEPGRWDFTRTVGYSTTQGLDLLPGNLLTISSQPRIRPVRLNFSSRNVVAGHFRLPGTSPNGMAEIFEDRILRTDTGEIVDPIKFRFQLPADDGTTYYDLVLTHMARNDKSGRTIGVFRYRLDDEEDWRIEDRPAGRAGQWGRLDTRDNHLTFEFASTQTPSANHLDHIVAYPVIGEITSPIVRLNSMPRGRLIADGEVELGSRIDLFVRHGSGTNESIQWTNWEPVDAGALLPPAPKGTGYFQWMARLVESPRHRPSLRGVRFEAGTVEVAIGQEQPR